MRPLLLATAFAGCSMPAAPQIPAAPTSTRAASAADAGSLADASLDAPPPLPDLAELAARGAAIAPGMREAFRLTATPEVNHPLIPSDTRDACVKVAFVSPVPIRVALENGAGKELTLTPRAASGVTHTACVHKGNTIILHVTADRDAGPAAEARFVGWVSP